MSEHLQDIWILLLGVTIFIMGMNFLEGALKNLAGRPFKLFLRKHTTNKIKAIGGGAIVTGVLQSSSIVNLIVLAFVGAGIIGMENALAVMLGSNVGTTLSSWLVATLGFKANIESLAFPLAGIAGICTVLFNKGSLWYKWSSFILGFGFLFVGLDYMKGSMEGLVNSIDLTVFREYNILAFALIGLFITSLIQSSSATVAIVLSALHADAITLYMAMGIVLGSETGTTLKLLIASIGGVAVKKRAAWGNFMFNIIGSIVVLMLLNPILKLITVHIGIEDNLIALVFFQTLVNVIGIILFYPLLDPLSRFLQKRFVSDEEETLFIKNVGDTEPDIGIEVLRKEVLYFIHSTAMFCQEIFSINSTAWRLPELEDYSEKKVIEKYEHIKRVHGHIHAYSTQMQNRRLRAEESLALDKLMFSVRNSMYAAKSMKDAYYDAEQLRNSSNDKKYAFFIQARERVELFYIRLIEIIDSDNKAIYFEELAALFKTVQDGYAVTLSELYKSDHLKGLGDTEISTLLNFNREMFTSFKSSILSVKDYLLNDEEAAYFDELPGFLR